MGESKNIWNYLRSEKIYNLLVIPIMIFLLIFFLWPIFSILLRSLYDPIFTFNNYKRVFSTHIYFYAFITTFKIAFLTSVICLMLGYPLSYLLSFVSRRTLGLLLVFILLPFWTSILVRTYAWMIILGRNGIMNNLLLKLGIVHSPLNLLYNLSGVLIGMVQIMLPFMILPLYSVMRGIDKDLLKASESLGANRYKTFWNIFFPLSAPGIKAGFLLVFMVSLGFFVTPALLGGRKTIMISMVIEEQTNWFVNWGFSSALTFILLLITIIFMGFWNKYVGIAKIVR